MLKRNLILATRIFFKNPLSSFITVGGLSLGIGCFLLLFIYVYNEYETDRFHKNYDGIYRVSMDFYVDGQLMFNIPPPAGMFYDLPNVTGLESGSRVFSPNDIVIEYGDLRFLEDGVVMVDSAWKTIFDFQYANNSFQLFNDPKKVIISSSVAAKLFGRDEAVGKQIKVGGEIYTVENILLNRGINSSMNINVILTFQTRKKSGVDINSYEDGHTPYFVLSSDMGEAEVQQSLQQLIADNTEEGFDVRISVTSLKDSNFVASNLKFQNGNLRGNKKYYVVFSVVGLIILFMAIINYINLVTARAATRSKEVGIKKTIGAQKNALWQQFMMESLAITVIAGVLGIGLAELALPQFNSLLVRPVNSDFLLTWQFLIIYAVGLIAVSLLAGIYPAFILTSFKPIGALNAVKLSGKSWLRSALVTIQFTITSLLIFGSLVIFKQVSFLSTVDLGFDTDQIVSVKASEEIKNHIQTIKNDLRNIAGIEYVSVGNLPGIGWMYSGSIHGKNVNVVMQQVDEDFMDMAGLELLEGRFLTDQDEDTKNTVINKTMRDLLFGDSTTVFGQMPHSEGQLVGVVNDFQFSSIKSEVRPLELKVGGLKFRDVLVRLNVGANAKEALSSIKSVFLKHDPDTVFEYSFLDEDYNNQFKSEQIFLTLLKVFTLVSIIIGGLGLFGLAQFNFSKNIKVIGIKKILGAPQLSVVFGLLKGVFKPITIGLLIALPLGYFMMSNWLDSYANKIKIDAFIILLTIAVICTITFLTVFYQIINSIKLKPIDTLHYE